MFRRIFPPLPPSLHAIPAVADAAISDANAGAKTTCVAVLVAAWPWALADLSALLTANAIAAKIGAVGALRVIEFFATSPTTPLTMPPPTLSLTERPLGDSDVAEWLGAVFAGKATVARMSIGASLKSVAADASTIIVVPSRRLGTLPDALHAEAEAVVLPPMTAIMWPRTVRSLGRLGLSVELAAEWALSVMTGRENHELAPETAAERSIAQTQTRIDTASTDYRAAIRSALDEWRNQLHAHHLEAPASVADRLLDHADRAAAQLRASADRDAQTLRRHAATVRGALVPHNGPQDVTLSADFLAETVGGPTALIAALKSHWSAETVPGLVLALA